MVRNNNKSIFEYNISNIKKDIEKNPFVKAAKISLEDSDKLCIEIIERVPIALVLYNDNKNFID